MEWSCRDCIKEKVAAHTGPAPILSARVSLPVGWLVGLPVGKWDELEKCRDHDGLSSQAPDQVTSSHIVMIQLWYLCDGLN